MKNEAQTPYSNRGFDAQFLCKVSRNKPLVLDGVIVSFDSLRLKYTFTKTTYDFETHTRFETLERLLFSLNSDGLFLEGLFDIHTSPEHGFKIGTYRRTITYNHSDGWSFAVLIGRYTYDNKVKLEAPEAILDVNPNKVPENAWRRIDSILRGWSISVQVQRFDLALDYPLNRSELTLQQRPGSGYQKFVDPKGAITEYTGERSHHAAIKLYDKGADLGEEGMTCTRLEITIEPDKYKGIAGLFPTILSRSPLPLNLDFSSLPYEVQSVLICPELLPVLKAKTSRNTWAKFQKMIRAYSQENGETVFALQTDHAIQIDRYVYSYLAVLNSTLMGVFA